jgi:hypothetical protein
MGGGKKSVFVLYRRHLEYRNAMMGMSFYIMSGSCIISCHSVRPVYKFAYCKMIMS